MAVPPTHRRRGLAATVLNVVGKDRRAALGLYRRGRVTNRGATRLVVRFDGEDQTVSIRPHRMRVIDGDGDYDG